MKNDELHQVIKDLDEKAGVLSRKIQVVKEEFEEASSDATRAMWNERAELLTLKDRMETELAHLNQGALVEALRAHPAIIDALAPGHCYDCIEGKIGTDSDFARLRCARCALLALSSGSESRFVFTLSCWERTDTPSESE